MKTCGRCSVASTDFGPNAARKDGLAVYCRTCTKAYMAAKRYDALRWARNREAESQRNAAYRSANQDRLRAFWRQQAATFRAENPASKRAWNIARKHGLARATPSWACRKTMNAVYAEAKRMEAADGVVRHVDHIVPLKHPLVCGLHVPANLRVLTADENMQKHNKFEVFA